MEATELRINNYYQAKSPEKTEWQTNYRLCNFGMQQALNNEINLRPMPLTLKWLENNGFDLSINKDSGCGHARLRNFSLWIDNEKIMYHTNHRITVLKEVHKLQNLYYAIESNELKRWKEKIKEKASTP